MRFVQSSADVVGNVIDGAVYARDGAALHADDNLRSANLALYLGRHRQRDLFREPLALDLNWAVPPPRRAAAATPPGLDLCGSARPAQPAYGAFEDFGACLAPTLGAR